MLALHADTSRSTKFFLHHLLDYPPPENILHFVNICIYFLFVLFSMHFKLILNKFLIFLILNCRENKELESI